MLAMPLPPVSLARVRGQTMRLEDALSPLAAHGVSITMAASLQKVECPESSSSMTLLRFVRKNK